jgi:hypothetical protein
MPIPAVPLVCLLTVSIQSIEWLDSGVRIARTHPLHPELPTQTTNQSTPPHSTATANIFANIVVMKIKTLRIVTANNAKRHWRNEGRAVDSTSAFRKAAIGLIAMKTKLMQQCTTVDIWCLIWVGDWRFGTKG